MAPQKLMKCFSKMVGKLFVCKIPINFEVFYPDAVEQDPDPVKKKIRIQSENCLDPVKKCRVPHPYCREPSPRLFPSLSTWRT